LQFVKTNKVISWFMWRSGAIMGPWNIPMT